jgi:hypothetical protein
MRHVIRRLRLGAARALPDLCMMLTLVSGRGWGANRAHIRFNDLEAPDLLSVTIVLVDGMHGL